MRIADNKGDHEGAIVCFLLAALSFLVIIAYAKHTTNINTGTTSLIAVFGMASFLILINMGLAITRDYWIDKSGAYVRILGGRVIRRKVLYENTRFFGVILIVSGKYAKKSIVFSEYLPKRSHDNGFSVRLRKTITIDYSPELFEQVQKYFEPPKAAIKMIPHDIA